MSTIYQPLMSSNLAKLAFSLRFAELQINLKATLASAGSDPDAVLALQDRLILRLEGWVDSLADLHMLTSTDIDIFRHTLCTNRKVYRMRVLAMHNVDISVTEWAALNHALKLTITKISSTATATRHHMESACGLH
jgi:hypothetical protein